MPDPNPTCVDDRDLWAAQRAVVMQLLRDDHLEPWSREELEAAIGDMARRTILAALVYLAIEEVVDVDGDGVRATKCAQHMDALGIVSI